MPLLSKIPALQGLRLAVGAWGQWPTLGTTGRNRGGRGKVLRWGAKFSSEKSLPPYFLCTQTDQVKSPVLAVVKSISHCQRTTSLTAPTLRDPGQEGSCLTRHGVGVGGESLLSILPRGVSGCFHSETGTYFFKKFKNSSILTLPKISKRTKFWNFSNRFNYSQL